MRLFSIAVICTLSVLAAAGQPPSQDAGPEVVTVVANPVPCPVRTPELEAAPSLLATWLPDGAIVFGGSYVEGRDLVTVLQAVLPDCEPVPGFGLGGTAIVELPVRSAAAVIDVIQATTGGGILLAGGAGADVIVRSAPCRWSP